MRRALGCLTVILLVILALLAWGRAARPDKEMSLAPANLHADGLAAHLDTVLARAGITGQPRLVALRLGYTADGVLTDLYGELSVVKGSGRQAVTVQQIAPDRWLVRRGPAVDDAASAGIDIDFLTHVDALGWDRLDSGLAGVRRVQFDVAPAGTTFSSGGYELWLAAETALQPVPDYTATRPVITLAFFAADGRAGRLIVVAGHL